MTHTHILLGQEKLPAPRIDDLKPGAALPLGEVELIGEHLGPTDEGPPAVSVDEEPALVQMQWRLPITFAILMLPLGLILIVLSFLLLIPPVLMFRWE